MKKSMLAILIISLFPAANAFANMTDKLVTISNDRTDVTNDLNLSIDSKGAVSNINYVTTDNGKTAEKDFSLKEIGTGDGAVLKNSKASRRLSSAARSTRQKVPDKWCSTILQTVSP